MTYMDLSQLQVWLPSDRPHAIRCKAAVTVTCLSEQIIWHDLVKKTCANPTKHHKLDSILLPP